MFDQNATKNLHIEYLNSSRLAIANFLSLSHDPAPVDLAFVLGSPSLSNLDPALDLYFKGYAKKIVISGMGPKDQEVSEAEKFKIYAIQKGVSNADIYTESLSKNTMENFIFSRKKIEEIIGWDNIKKVAICGKPFHMRRAFMTALAHWPVHIQLFMIPSRHPDDPPLDVWWETEHGRALVLKELMSIGEYALKGDIGGF